MAARLILNADDFGLTLGVNRAIRELHQAGVLTSATLMATGSAFDDAVAIAHAHPTLGVGCHIVLTDGTPVSPPETIPTLLGPDGRTFRPKLVDFVLALLRGRISEEEIERETRAQVVKLQRAGIDVTHLDTHKHTHLFPAVTRPLLRIAENGSIGAIRNPFEPRWCRSLGRGSFTRRLQLALLDGMRGQYNAHRQIRNGYVLSTEGSIGVSATGQLNRESLRQLLAILPDGLWELVCHPGYNDADLDTVTTRLREHRDIEREALLSEIPRALAQPNAPQLIHYGNLGFFGLMREMGVHAPDTGFDHV
jgi:hopanoid biosynthesis associated protein HpnK